MNAWFTIIRGVYSYMAKVFIYKKKKKKKKKRVHRVDDFVKSIKWTTSSQEDEIISNPQNGRLY